LKIGQNSVYCVFLCRGLWRNRTKIFRALGRVLVCALKFQLQMVGHSPLAPEPGAINRLHFSGTGFWYVFHAHQGPDSSGTRVWLRL